MGEDTIIDEERNITKSELSGPVVDRRTTIKILSALGVTGLAGCTGGDGGDGGDGGSGDGGDGDGGGGDGGDGGSGDGGGDGGDGGDGEGNYGGRLRAGWLAQQFEILDPQRTELSQIMWLIQNIFSGLVEVTPNYRIQGDLAKDWTIENGGTSYVFDLVEGVKFHNGDDFTAEDVAYSLRRIRRLDDSPHTGRIAPLQSFDNGGIEIEDDYRIRLNLDEPFAPLLGNFTCDIGYAGAIVSQSAIEELGPEEYRRIPVATGPFKVASHTFGETLSVDRYEDYKNAQTEANGQDLPYLDGIDFEPLNEDATRMNALIGGDTHFAVYMPNNTVNQANNHDDIVIERRPGLSIGGIGFNCANEPFDSVAVREAATRAINKERFNEQGFAGFAEPSDGIITPPMGDWYRPAEEKPVTQEFDPDRARELAEQEGVTGIEVTITTPPPSQAWAEAAKPMWEEILDWDVTIDVIDYTSLFPTVQDGEYQMLPWGGSDLDPNGLLYDNFGPLDRDDNQNWWQWESEEAQEKLVEQRRLVDQEERQELIWDIEDTILGDFVWVFTSFRETVDARSTAVKGYEHYGLKRFRHVWLDE